MLLAGIVTAFWLGVLTSISPCPLATNIAAISFLSKRLGGARPVMISSAAYIAGRVLTYLTVGAIVVAGLLSIPGVSNFLQKYMNRILGPLLMLTGILLMGWIKFTLPGLAPGSRLQSRVERGGVWGPLALGAVFALTFCPVSAALFFGSLIPLALEHNSPVLFPAVYGIGTGIPVVVFAILVAMGAQWVGKAFNRLSDFEKWARRVTGILFIVIGLYYVLTFHFKWDAMQYFYR